MVTMPNHRGKDLPINRPTVSSATKASLNEQNKRKNTPQPETSTLRNTDRHDSQSSQRKKSAIDKHSSAKPPTPKRSIVRQQVKHDCPGASMSRLNWNGAAGCGAKWINCESQPNRRIRHKDDYHPAKYQSNYDDDDDGGGNGAAKCGAIWTNVESQPNPNPNQQLGHQGHYRQKQYQSNSGDDVDDDDDDDDYADDHDDDHADDKTVGEDSNESTQNVSMSEFSRSEDLQKFSPAQNVPLSTGFSYELSNTETEQENSDTDNKPDLPARDQNIEELSETFRDRLNLDDNDKTTNNLRQESNGTKPKQRSTQNKSKDEPEERYRPFEKQGYSYSLEDLTDTLNLQFYNNEIKYKPWGCKIEKLLDCKGDYGKLETDHSYIQWLFPTQEASKVNSYSQPVKFEEAEKIRETPELKDRFLRAYKMMLDFYGMKLKSEETGEVQRNGNWDSRLEHLNRSKHNHYRITRIITALGIYGYEHFQKPWLMFILEEMFVTHKLSFIPHDVLFHWIEVVNRDDDRTDITQEFTRLASDET